MADAMLKSRLDHSGAVLIEGPRGCGKTETARQIAASEVRLDTDPNVGLVMQTDPSLLLQGEIPRLIDEWQEEPALWNHIRRAIDDRQGFGEFILTGSCTPRDTTRMHSGAGRISRLRMRPMSLTESGIGVPQVSLKSLLQGEAPQAEPSELTLRDIADVICRGGWPANLELSTKDCLEAMRSYLEILVEVDVPNVSNSRRDPLKLQRFARSLARNISTQASLTTLVKDVHGDDDTLSRVTANEYLVMLQRLLVVEELPAWSTHLRSSATLRKTPTRHFVDPALAVAAVQASPAALLKDLNYLGLLFESLVIRDLRVYADSIGARIRHYRDSHGNEVDAIIECADGSWGAFEIKLGPGAIPDAVESLTRLAGNVNTKKMGKPQCLTVITGWGYTQRLPLGVNVVPLPVLMP